MRIGIIGGGVLGLVAGLLRAERGDSVTIWERSPEIGGLAASFPIDLTTPSAYLEKFYHHIFRTDTAMIRWMDVLGLSDKMLWGNPPTCTYWQGQIHRMDSWLAELPMAVRHAVRPLIGTNFDTALALLNFAPLPFADRVRFGLMGAQLKRISNASPFTGQTAVDWVRREAGETVFVRVFLPLLQGKFGDRYAEIAMSWLWSRFHERTQQLGYLRGGFHQLYDAMASAFQDKGGTIHLNATVSQIRTGDGTVQVRSADDTMTTVDRLLITTPTHTFLEMAKDELPIDYIRQYTNAVAYRAAHCLILAMDRSFGDFYWLNVNDSGYPFLALVEHTNFLSSDDYKGQHLLYIGNYLSQADPLLSMTASDVFEKFCPYLEQIKPGFSKEHVQRLWSWSARDAQPIVTTDYPDRLPPHVTPLPNVYVANMAHVYPQDRGQNYSILLGEQMADIL